MPRRVSTRSTATSGERLQRFLRVSAKGGICEPGDVERWIARLLRRPRPPSPARHRPATRRLRNAAAREATGKPCAGNPHARFERGSCSNVRRKAGRKVRSTNARGVAYGAIGEARARRRGVRMGVFDERLLAQSRGSELRRRDGRIRRGGAPRTPARRVAGQRSGLRASHATQEPRWKPEVHEPADPRIEPLPSPARAQSGGLASLGREAFAVAKAERQPVFLSVGYSTCHWCHVMEKSPSRTRSRRVPQRALRPIKVDREERPDIDAVYMGYVQADEGGGGWPMNVWLTPGRKPFFGGTYFAPHAGVHGARRGFLDVLRELSQRFQEEGGEVASEAAAFSKRMQESVAPGGRQVISRTLRSSSSPSIKPRRAGGTFGGARRTPRPRPFPVRMLLRLRASNEGREGGSEMAAADAGGHGCGRYPRWRSAGASIVTPRIRDGSSPTSRRCSTTTRSSRRPTSRPARRPGRARFLATAGEHARLLLRDMRAPDGTFSRGDRRRQPRAPAESAKRVCISPGRRASSIKLSVRTRRASPQAWFAVSRCG